MAGLDQWDTCGGATEAPPIDSVPKFAILERPSLTISIVTGSPAMSVLAASPTWPLSVQIVGKRFADATVLRAAHA